MEKNLIFLPFGFGSFCEYIRDSGKSGGNFPAALPESGETRGKLRGGKEGRNEKFFQEISACMDAFICAGLSDLVGDTRKGSDG